MALVKMYVCIGLYANRKSPDGFYILKTHLLLCGGLALVS